MYHVYEYHVCTPYSTMPCLWTIFLYIIKLCKYFFRVSKYCIFEMVFIQQLKIIHIIHETVFKNVIPVQRNTHVEQSTCSYMLVCSSTIFRLINYFFLQDYIHAYIVLYVMCVKILKCVCNLSTFVTNNSACALNFSHLMYRGSMCTSSLSLSLVPFIIQNMFCLLSVHTFFLSRAWIHSLILFLMSFFHTGKKIVSFLYTILNKKIIARLCNKLNLSLVNNCYHEIFFREEIGSLQLFISVDVFST